MKSIFPAIYALAIFFCSPASLLGQESLLIKTIRGNSKIIYSVAFSPDGKSVVSSGVDNTLKVWRLEDGAYITTLRGHRSAVNSVVFSPDGKSLASASEDSTIKIWNSGTGACVTTLKGHRDSVLSVVFFPDGKRLASGSADGMINLWRIGSTRPYKTFNNRSGYIYSVSVSSGGKSVASASMDTVIKIWNVERGDSKITLDGHNKAVNAVAFSPDGDYLVSGSDDGLVKIWRAKDGLCLKTFSANRQQVHSVAYSPDGAYVFSSGGGGTVNGWPAAGNGAGRTFKGHRGDVKSVVVAADGKYLASGSFDKTIKIWLTPWEADRREKEIQSLKEEEAAKDRNYAVHYAAGLQLLAAPSIENLEKAVVEFTEALSQRRNADCEAKLKETVRTMNSMKLEAFKAQNERQRLTKQAVTLGLGSFIILGVTITATRALSRIKKKMRFVKTLPDEIKRAAATGDYTDAFKLYTEYKAAGGKTRKLPQEDLLRLYHGMGALNDLPKEDVPYDFLLAYAVKFGNAGNFRTALGMFRSGRLLDEFKKTAEFDAFAEIYEKAGRPENLLMFKLRPDTYSNLAEAFFRAGNYDCCKKIHGYKKQFHSSKVSRRDNELLSLSEKAGTTGNAALPS
ncbi:MAG: WD40 repeat domain-containing protein [Elusimicrobia bacterium]|nr:WD40 repeat domain-containing protein [Elusimicrobiota bacterium]